MTHNISHWRETYTWSSPNDVQLFLWWQSTNDVYLIDNEKVVKVYTNEKQYEKNKRLQQVQVSFAPRIYECIDSDDRIDWSLVVMEYIEWKNLTELFYTMSEDEQLDIYRKLGDMLRDIHTMEVQEIEVDTWQLYTNVRALFDKALTVWLLEVHQIAVLQEFLDWYTPRKVKTIWCRIHGDFHMENVMVTSEWSLKVIDRDSSQINHPMMECAMLLEQSIIPLGIVEKWLEKHYPHGLCMNGLEEIASVYPALFDKEWKDEIILQWVNRMLFKYTVNPEIPWVEKAVGMWRKVYDVIFEEKFVEKLCDL